MNRVCSIFSQILQLISRTGFDTAARKHKVERHARGFTSWGQFVAMLFCQLGGAKSLREICGGLAASEGKLRHLGLPQAPARSTLAYANEHRPWQYEALDSRDDFFQRYGRYVKFVLCNKCAPLTFLLFIFEELRRECDRTLCSRYCGLSPCERPFDRFGKNFTLKGEEVAQSPKVMEIFHPAVCDAQFQPLQQHRQGISGDASSAIWKHRLKWVNTGAGQRSSSDRSAAKATRTADVRRSCTGCG